MDIYNSFLTDLINQDIDINGDTFYCMLVTSSYTFNATNQHRSDITGEVPNGGNYSQGGHVCTITKNQVGGQIDLTLSITSWTASTISAAGAVIYQSTGTPSTDRLVCYMPFGGTFSTIGTTFAVNVSAPLSIAIS